MKNKKCEDWDSCWHLFVFDLSKKHSSAFERLDKALSELGLIPIESGFYFHPFDCFLDVKSVAESFEVGSCFSRHSFDDHQEMMNFVLNYK